MIDALVAVGYSEEATWHFTPRKGWALLFAADKRRQRERKELLALHALAAQGDGKTVRKALKDES